jgi:polysaccharide export outer membrane protein
MRALIASYRSLLSLCLGLFWSVGVLAQTGVPATAAADTVRLGPPTEADYRIGAEDVLAIVVNGQPDYTRTVPVRPDGRISLPLVNDIQAAGLTPEQLRAAVTKGFERFIKQQVLEVTVIVTEVNSVKVAVLGQVRNPIRFVLRSRATLLDAIAMAGGFTEFAKRDRIQLLRSDGSRLTFNYDRFLNQPDTGENLPLRAGDIIIIP